MGMRGRETLVAVAIGVLVCCWITEGHAQDGPPPTGAVDQLLLIQIVSGVVPPSRPTGTSGWDPEPIEHRPLVCDLAELGVGAAAGVAGTPAAAAPAGGAAGRICDALTRRPPNESDPRAPDVVVEVDLGLQRARFQTAAAPDTASPSWEFGFYLFASQVPQAGIDLHVFDADRDGRREDIDSVAIPRQDILRAAAQDGRLVQRGRAGVEVALRVEALALDAPSATRTFDLRLPSVSVGEVAPSPVVPRGARVRIEASGNVVLGDPRRFPSTGADGSADLGSRSYNLPAFPSAPFGSVVMWLGQDPAARQKVVVGSCVEFVALEVGLPVFAVNDRSRDSNRGEFAVHVMVRPPEPGTDPVATQEQRCGSSPGVATASTQEARAALATLTSISLVLPRTKANNAPWDGDNSPPDAFVVLSQGGRALGRSRTVRDRFDPQITFSNVTMDTASTLVVEVMDEDLVANDPIGTAVINLAAGETRAALGNAGQVAIELQASGVAPVRSLGPPIPVNTGPSVQPRARPGAPTVVPAAGVMPIGPR